MTRRFTILLAALALSGPALAQEPASEGPLPFDALPADAVAPFGGMAISPTRVIIQPGEAGGQVTLYNAGAEPVSYRIDAVDLALDQAGGYRELEEGEDAPWSALPLVRYAPRQITLQPGERQAVKIISTAARDLPPREYRSHLRFSSIPAIAPVSADEDAAALDSETRTVTVSVGLDYRITIPLLLRTAGSTGGAALAGASESRTAEGQRQLDVQLARTGTYSDYGAIRVLDAAGAEIGVLRGVAVLPPLEQRSFAVPLQGDARPARVLYEIGGDGEDARPIAELTLG